MLDAKITTLLAVVEKQSFTKAAEALGLTQPAVSQHIRQLEEDLGIKLFNRADRSLGLTKEGEIAVKYARRIVQLYQNLKLAIKDSKKNIKHLTVGVSHTSESNMVSEVFAKYAKEHEGVNIRIISDDINNLYTRLKTYQIDLIAGRTEKGKTDFAASEFGNALALRGASGEQQRGSGCFQCDDRSGQYRHDQRSGHPRFRRIYSAEKRVPERDQKEKAHGYPHRKSLHDAGNQHRLS